MHICVHLGITGTAIGDGREIGITVVPTGTVQFTVGVPVNLQLVASGGVAPYTFEFSSAFLPPDLSMSTSGLITGTPLSTYNNKASNIMVTDADLDFSFINIKFVVVA